MGAYLGLDLGGTGAKAGLFDGDGRLLGQGHARYAPRVCGEGRAEIPIEEIETAAREATRQALAGCRAPVAALAVSSQGQTFVSLDAEGRPLHPAILWYDSRAAAEAEELRREVLSRAPREPVPHIEAIATVAKMLWLRRHHPAAMARARRHLLLPDYLSYRLTGAAVTDPCTASSTGLFADDAPAYAPEVLAAAAIEANALARIQASGTPVARVRPEAAEEWGLSPRTLLVSGTNDQYSGALGAGNCRPGILTETTGTCLALVTLAEELPDPLPAGLIGGRFPIPRYRFALAYAKTAGLVLEWFQRSFCPEKSLDDLEALAAASPAGSRGVTVVPHFDGMVSPAPNPEMRGAFCHLALGHTPGDLYRALLESIAFSLRENVELLRSAGFSPEGIRSLGGGARSDLWLRIKADVTGLPVARPAVTEAATLGAAMLAAVGHGAYPDLEACSRDWCRLERTFLPDPDAHARYEAPYARYRSACRWA